MARAFSDNTNSFNVLNHFSFTATDDESKILAWLSPLEPQVRHRDICSQRVESVGDWLLGTEEFKSWYDSGEGGECDHAALFCYGDPGVGKSYVSSLVVDYLCDRATERDMAVICFYYDYASREEQSPRNMLGSVLKQLLYGLGSIPVEIVQSFRSRKKVIGGRELQLPDIVNMFLAAACIQPTFICVDALDECVPKHCLEVLDALRQILRRSPNTRMFMTGRSHIRGTVERGFSGRATSVSIKPRNDDVLTYLRTRLRKDTTPEVMDSRLENEILNSIPQEVTESFLLASLKVEAILRETTIHRRRKRLRGIGDGLGLGDAYSATLERIRAQDGEKVKLAMTTLMWICYSERPLQEVELGHALAVEVGSTDFNRDNIPATETLLTCCQGLVTVDKGASTVRLIHHTLQEYLSTEVNLFPRAHSAISETCLAYLNSDQARALSAKPQPDLSDLPFLKYCSRYWGTHANRELSDQAKFLAMELLEQHENHVAAESLFEQILEPDDSPEVNAPSRFSSLHCASYFGIVEVMAALLGRNGCDINQTGSAGLTPLTWAVRKGQDEAVKLLLGQEAISPNKPDNEGRTSLYWAAIDGHCSAVKQLLNRNDVSPDKPDNEGCTPLSWAAYNGHELVVKQLLDQQDVNPNKPDNDGCTPLSWAANNGHELVVRQLLDRQDVNPDTPDNDGCTPLSRAASNGDESVVKLLLDRKDINPNKPDNEGCTPLHWALIWGHEPVVRQLLDRQDVNPDTPDKEGWTPLSSAASNGDESGVKLLLDRKDVNPDRPDNEGRTPLSWAAINGHEAVVEQLLDRQDVDPDKPDNEGRTPLSWAAIKGHEPVVEQLLDLQDVDPDKPDGKGRAPLSWAANNGHEPVVEQLLDRQDVNPNKPDNQGKTPLSWAATRGRELVVELLLDRQDVNPAKPDGKGRTPLSWAANSGHESVVRQLLDRQDVNPNKPDNEGCTPLSWAAINGHELVVRQLLDRQDVNPNKLDNEGCTPLHWAAVAGHGSVVKQLLDRQDVDADKPDSEGKTPLYVKIRDLLILYRRIHESVV